MSHKSIQVWPLFVRASNSAWDFIVPECELFTPLSKNTNIPRGDPPPTPKNLLLLLIIANTRTKWPCDNTQMQAGEQLQGQNDHICTFHSLFSSRRWPIISLHRYQGCNASFPCTKARQPLPVFVCCTCDRRTKDRCTIAHLLSDWRGVGHVPIHLSLHGPNRCGLVLRAGVL